MLNNPSGEVTKMKSGYFGIGIYNTKNESNLGVLWRSAHNFGADFIFTIGKRYKKQCSDTTKAYRHIPLHHYANMQDFNDHVPYDCPVVCIEQSEKSVNIVKYVHPKKCIYLLGAEDYGLPQSYMADKAVIHISSPMCLNVSVAGSIIMFDRLSKEAK